MPTEKTAFAYGNAVQRCVEEIRNAILQGTLLPGQHIKQEAIAKELGVSRSPARDALGRLSADGVLVHTPNSGYSVARFDLEELDQLYRMRELLETELLRGVAPLPEAVLSTIESEHEAVCEAAREGHILNVLLVSAEYADLASLCDRVLVIGESGVYRELTAPSLSEGQIVDACYRSLSAVTL